MDRRLLELLNDLAFSEHPEIPQLYQKYVDKETTAYIDFRKDRNGNAKGRRFAKRGKDFVDDPDEIEVLRQYKTERDRILRACLNILYHLLNDLIRPSLLITR